LADDMSSDELSAYVQLCTDFDLRSVTN